MKWRDGNNRFMPLHKRPFTCMNQALQINIFAAITNRVFARSSNYIHTYVIPSFKEKAIAE